jgi:hypothetical protein
MRFVRVQYDACNRQFKLMNDELSSQMEDGGIYLMAGPSADDFAPAAEPQDARAELLTPVATH